MHSLSLVLGLLCGVSKVGSIDQSCRHAPHPAHHLQWTSGSENLKEWPLFFKKHRAHEIAPSLVGASESGVKIPAECSAYLHPRKLESATLSEGERSTNHCPWRGLDVTLERPVAQKSRRFARIFHHPARSQYCGQLSRNGEYMVIIVSRPKDKDIRSRWRQRAPPGTSHLLGRPVKHGQFYDRVDKQTENEIAQEANEYGDIIWLDMEESWSNLSIKQTGAWQWIKECGRVNPDLKWAVFMQEDLEVNWLLLERLLYRFSAEGVPQPDVEGGACSKGRVFPPDPLILGPVSECCEVVVSGRPCDRYNEVVTGLHWYPTFALGFFQLLTPGAAEALVESREYFNAGFHNDDVFTGLLSFNKSFVPQRLRGFFRTDWFIKDDCGVDGADKCPCDMLLGAHFFAYEHEYRARVIKRIEECQAGSNYENLTRSKLEDYVVTDRDFYRFRLRRKWYHKALEYILPRIHSFTALHSQLSRWRFKLFEPAPIYPRFTGSL